MSNLLSGVNHSCSRCIDFGPDADQPSNDKLPHRVAGQQPPDLLEQSSQFWSDPQSRLALDVSYDKKKHLIVSHIFTCATTVSRLTKKSKSLTFNCLTYLGTRKYIKDPKSSRYPPKRRAELGTHKVLHIVPNFPLHFIIQ